MKAKTAKPAAQSASGKPGTSAATSVPETAQAIAASAAKRAKAPSAKTPGKAAPAAEEKSKKSIVAKPEKIKIRKPKLVRDSFTMPENEYAMLAEIKHACLQAGFEVKKSQLLRIGVVLVKALDTASLRKRLDALAPLKPGRPKSSSDAKAATHD